MTSGVPGVQGFQRRRRERLTALLAEANVAGFGEAQEHAKATYVPAAVAAERVRLAAAVRMLDPGAWQGWQDAIVAVLTLLEEP